MLLGLMLLFIADQDTDNVCEFGWNRSAQQSLECAEIAIANPDPHRPDAAHWLYVGEYLCKAGAYRTGLDFLENYQAYYMIVNDLDYCFEERYGQQYYPNPDLPGMARQIVCTHMVTGNRDVDVVDIGQLDEQLAALIESDLQEIRDMIESCTPSN